jgi:predicted AlkP superfamily pyrophosphatase or phosphodiesterase
MKKIRNAFFKLLFGFFIILITFILSSGCSFQNTTSKSLDGKPTIILISIDGFRWDYPEKTDTPNLRFLITTGVRAKALIPSFPTKTFPNHYTIVTGLYPENHGIIANNMYDPEMREKFSLGNQAAIEDGRWWGGEPIWVTAEKHDLITASFFWPGTETKIKGIQPTCWFPYDGGISNEERMRQVLSWLDLPSDKRPSFITVYFSSVDDAGHDGGPDSKEVITAIQEIDGVLGLLLQGLKERNILNKINIIIVSDHGMTAISSDRVIFLDDYIDLSNVDVIDWSPVLALNPKPGLEDAIYNDLVRAHPRLKIYRKEEMPLRFHYRKSPRIPAIIGVADEGWSIGTHETFKSKPYYFTGGNHGFDNQLPSMGAIFIARGPAFKSGLVVPAFQNIHLYELMAAVLNIEPAPNDGNLDSVRVMLRP